MVRLNNSSCNSKKSLQHCIRPLIGTLGRSAALQLVQRWYQKCRSGTDRYLPCLVPGEGRGCIRVQGILGTVWRMRYPA